MAVTQTTLTAAETINIMKVGGKSDKAIDRKEEAQAILKFAKIKMDVFMKTKAGNSDDLVEILGAAVEADKYMMSGADDISAEDLKKYKEEKEKGLLGKLVDEMQNWVKLFGKYNKQLDKIQQNINKQNAQLNQHIQNLQTQIPTVKVQVNTGNP